MQNFFQGATVRITVTFENSAHVVTDPSTIVAKVSNPGGATTTYTYNVDAQPVRVSTGVYYIDIDLNAAGVWHYRFEGTGSVKAASQDSLLCVAANPA